VDNDQPVGPDARAQAASAAGRINRGDNDPGVLLRDLAAALDRIEPLGPGMVDAVGTPPVAVVDAVLPQLGSALASTALPAVLVLDDVHLLENRDCLDAVTRLIDYLPVGSQLTLASRGEPPLPLARLRAEGRVVEVGPDDLAMDSQEAGALLEHGHVDADGVDVAELVRRTEGWPVALHFAALSLGSGRRRDAREAILASDDRFLVDYLQCELLSRLPERQLQFLTRCSALERLSGPLCDAVLATTGSADLLESLSRSNLLTTPLDRRRQWYRLHRLFRELLGSRLERQDPALALELTRRAAGWCEANGLPEQAVEYAMAAGDADQVARVVAAAALPAYADGRLGRLERWLGWFEANRLVDRYPAVAALGAWVKALTGHPAAAERWAEALGQRAAAGARRAWLERYPVGALLRAVTARLAIHRGDVARARDDLALAERLGAGLTWALPHLAAQVRLELARNYLALTDVAAARTVLREVDDLLARRPRLGILGDQAAALRAQLDAMRAAAVGAASLTAAELRLLRLLGTHFSFREIGDQLQLSQHTVKSQAMSIYRKFGMSSRSEAIRHARDLGLLVE
jgi:ATP/maltotriose-dependent transcriptional regulator MalT